MWKIWVVLAILCFASFDACGQKLGQVFKVDSSINTIFSGNGFAFNTIGYERFWGHRNVIGFSLGGNAKTSRFDLGEEITTSSIVNYILMIDYYYYFHKYENNGFYLAPSIFYENIFASDNIYWDGYGVNLGVGYRHTFSRFVLSTTLFSSFEQIKQKNDIYIYRSREIKPIDVKVSIGYGF